MNNDRIAQIVADAIADAHAAGDNWPDYVEDALESEGVALADDQGEGEDPWEIVRLADGRTVFLADESATGAERYLVTRRNGYTITWDADDSGAGRLSCRDADTGEIVGTLPWDEPIDAGTDSWDIAGAMEQQTGVPMTDWVEHDADEVHCGTHDAAVDTD